MTWAASYFDKLVQIYVPELVNQDHRAPVGMIFLSILLVIAVVLASLALVYVGDKYWSLLEIKLFGIPYTRSRGREGEAEGGAGTTEYHTGEDNVNLIWRSCIVFLCKCTGNEKEKSIQLMFIYTCVLIVLPFEWSGSML